MADPGARSPAAHVARAIQSNREAAQPRAPAGGTAGGGGPSAPHVARAVQTGKGISQAKPQPGGGASAGRTPAPHVARAVQAGRGISQAKTLPGGAVPAGRTPASHVEQAVLAGRGVSQARTPGGATPPAGRTQAPHVALAVQAARGVAGGKQRDPRPIQVRMAAGAARISPGRAPVIQPSLKLVEEENPVSSTYISGPHEPEPHQANPWAGPSDLNKLSSIIDGSGQKVKTAGGTWVAKEYWIKPGIIDKTARGAHMVLYFFPEYPAQATQIVLIQTVRTVKNDRPDFLDKTGLDRSVYFTSIDQESESTTPVYSSNPKQPEETLEKAVGTEFGEPGYRILKKESEEALPIEEVKPAWLRDDPHRREIDPERFSAQIFETTALAVEGRDDGTYYGSVQWGWFIDRKGKHRLIPLAVVSFGSVSELFSKAAEQWNKTRTSKGKKPLHLPFEYYPPPRIGSIN